MEWFEKQIIPASFFKTKTTLCLAKETLGKVLLILDDTGKITASKIKKIYPFTGRMAYTIRSKRLAT